MRVSPPCVGHDFDRYRNEANVFRYSKMDNSHKCNGSIGKVQFWERSNCQTQHPLDFKLGNFTNYPKAYTHDCQPIRNFLVAPFKNVPLYLLVPRLLPSLSIVCDKSWEEPGKEATLLISRIAYSTCVPYAGSACPVARG